LEKLQLLLLQLLEVQSQWKAGFAILPSGPPPAPLQLLSVQGLNGNRLSNSHWKIPFAVAYTVVYFNLVCENKTLGFLETFSKLDLGSLVVCI